MPDLTPGGGASSSRRRVLALWVALAAQLMFAMDLLIVVVALPRIQKDLGFRTAALTWVPNAFGLACSGLLLRGGRLGNILGQVCVSRLGLYDQFGVDPVDNSRLSVPTRLLVLNTRLPVIAAGSIMDGAGIAAVLDLGAVAAPLGTAFIACPESAADDAYRVALAGPGAYHTSLKSLISGRPARALANRFTGLAAALGDRRSPDCPIAYDAGKALHMAAKAKGEHGFGAQWAGQGHLSRVRCRRPSWSRCCERSGRSVETRLKKGRFA
jgi:hypothetical protein